MTWRLQHFSWLCCLRGTKDPERRSALKILNWQLSSLMQNLGGLYGYIPFS